MVDVTDEPNRAQAAHWQEAGRHWVAHEQRYDRQLRPFLEAILEKAALRPGMRVLDVGCGFGTLTLEAARAVAPDGSVIGIDLSAPMLELARTRGTGSGTTNVTFLQADAQTYRLDGHADRVISRHGVMFFDDPEAAFANLAAALRPGGRVAVAVWQGPERNPWMGVPMVAAASVAPVAVAPPGGPGPFSLGDEDRVRSLLAAAGLQSVELHPVEVPLPLAGGGGLDEVVDFLGDGTVGRALGDAPADQRAAALDAVRDALRPYLGPEGVVLDSAAWVVTAERP